MAEANLTRDEARERARLVLDVTYEISLDLTTGEDTFGCEEVLRFDCAEPGAPTFLDYSGSRVESAVLNGEELSSRSFDGTRIHLPKLAGRNELRVRAASQYQRTGVGMHRFVDPTDDKVYMYTDLEPFECHRVFPCFDQPDIKATFGFVVNAPAGATVISNVPATSRPPEGEAGWWSFALTPRISTYITAVVAGPYHSWHQPHDGIDLGLYCRESLARYFDPEEFFEITKQGFDYYHRVFDYRYFIPKYDQVIVPEFNSGAMENLGCVTYNEAYIYRGKVTDASRERRAEVILHEMAHMWFGDLVTMRWWDDLWLNESFATFMAHVAMDDTRFEGGWVTFANEVKAQARRQDELPTTHPITADVPDTISTRVMFDAISYSKGASVLRQLVAWVGEDSFFNGVNSYFRRHEYGNTELKDFLIALEEASGRDLTEWSKQWLETAGVNTMAADFQTKNGSFSSFKLIQGAPREYPTIRSHRLGVGLFDANGRKITRRKRVEADVLGVKTQLDDLVGEKVPDLLLINDGDLSYAKVKFDERSLETIKTRLRDVEDPLTRALCWASAWEMLGDAELSATDYIDLIVNNIGGETEIGVVQQLVDQPRSTLSGVVVVLLGRARAAVEVFGAPGRREGAIARLSGCLLNLAEHAEPGSDRQLQFMRGFITAAHSAEHLRFLQDLLDGGATISEMEIDTELRWLILRILAASGEADEEAIAAELRRDPTDAGQRYAARCLAARPSQEAKADAWGQIVDPAQTRAMMLAHIFGFQQVGQETLLEPYADEFFQALQGVWDTRPVEVSQAFAAYAYPHVLVSPDTLNMTDAYISAKDPAPPLERILLEAREGIVSALAARKKDAPGN